MAIAALVSCSKDEETNAPAINSSKKSVQITIANGNGATRAGENGVTAGNSGETAVTCEATELSILFANDGGTILKVMDLVAAEDDKKDHVAGTAEYVPGKAAEADTYLWHNVPAAVTQVAVVRCEASDITITPGTTTLDQVEELAVNEEKNLNRPITEVVLYDESRLGEKGQLCKDVDGTEFYVYPASLTVKPKFARFELTQISCTDLGDKNCDTGEDAAATVGLDWITVNSLTWSSNKASYKIDPAVVGTMYGSYVPEGENATDKVLNANDANTAEVWSWNVKESSFVSMLLDCTVGAYAYQVASDSAELYVNGLAANSGATTGDSASMDWKEGNIYRVALDFTESDLSGQEGLCVKVSVTIVDWKVNNVYPVFGDR